MPPVIEVSAAVVEDDAGRLLLVRKRGTARFMQCGGKPEAGETAAETLVRELAEEVRLVVAVSDLAPMGTFTAPAANEAGHDVLAHVFRLAPLSRTTAEALGPSEEIEELVWFDPDLDDGAYLLAPLFEDVVLGMLRRG